MRRGDFERPGPSPSSTNDQGLRRPSSTNTSTTGIQSSSQRNESDALQHAFANTPASVSTSSIAGHTPIEGVGQNSQQPPPLHMSVQPQAPQPPAGLQSNLESIDYTSYGYEPGGVLAWDWNTDFPDFTRFHEPQGELVQELQRTVEDASNYFALPQPVARGESETAASLAEQTAVLQQTPESIIQSPAQMPPAVAGPRPPDPPPPPARMSSIASTQTSLKRKSESEPSSAILPVGEPQPPPAKKPAKTRSSSNTTPVVTQADRRPMATRSQSAASATGTAAAPRPTLTAEKSVESTTPREGEPSSARPAATEEEQTSPATERASAANKSRKIVEISSKFNNILPAGKVFPIQIGSELFRLSGASISSDAPSYFSHFFSEQLLNNSGKSGSIRTLYIDRDPQTFRDISLHLQGYHVKPRDGEHYVRLFADAQFYSLPRLTQQLFKTDIYIQIGDRNFQIPRDIFSSPGNSPNFFSLGFAHFFSTPSEVFPGLDRTSLLRPPSIQPPSVPNRSADVFEDLLRLLQGYPVHIRNEDHRQDLLRDARYFHLKGLEQKLIPCETSFNLARQKSEILIRLEDIRQSGISFSADPESGATATDIQSAAGGGPISAQSGPGSKPATPSSALTPAAAGANPSTPKVPSGYICYARPFTDESSHMLVVETSTLEATRIDLAAMRATFAGATKARVASLFQVIANKMNLPATQPLGLMMVERGGGLAAMPVSPSNSGVSGDRVRVEVGRDSWCELDGGVVEWVDVWDQEVMDEDEDERPALPPVRSWTPAGVAEGEQRRLDPVGEWIVSRAHWRLRVQPAEDDARIVEVVMQAVKLQASTGERTRNGRRDFLM